MINVDSQKILARFIFTWLWNNSVNVKLDERGKLVKIHHIIDNEKLLGVNNLDEFIINKASL